MWPVAQPGRTLIWGEYLDVICMHLEAVLRGEISHLLILIPPGCLKSVIACVLFPAWTWIEYPGVQFTCATATDELAMRDSVACRALIDQDLYWRGYIQRPDQAPKWVMRPNQDTKHKFENTQRGWREITSTGGTVVGLKSDIQILDDPMDAKKVDSKAYRDHIIEWHDKAFHNRVNDYTQARRIMIGQHTHYYDLQSHVMKQGNYEVLKLVERKDGRVSATCLGWVDRRAEGEYLRPERFGPKEEKAERRILGNRVYEAQHQQNPQRNEGKTFDRAHVKFVRAAPVGLTAVRYFDIASSTDDAACATASVFMGKSAAGDYYVLGGTHDKVGPDERNNIMRAAGRDDVRRTSVHYKGLWFEQQPAAAGIDQAKAIVKHLAGLPVHHRLSSGDKFVRAEGLAAQWESGNVYVVEDGTNDEWVQLFLDMMEAFGPGSPPNLLDIGDAAAGAFNELMVAATDVDPEAGDGEAGEAMQADRDVVNQRF